MIRASSRHDESITGRGRCTSSAIGRSLPSSRRLAALSRSASCQPADAVVPAPTITNVPRSRVSPAILSARLIFLTVTFQPLGLPSVLWTILSRISTSTCTMVEATGPGSALIGMRLPSRHRRGRWRWKAMSASSFRAFSAVMPDVWNCRAEVADAQSLRRLEQVARCGGGHPGQLRRLPARTARRGDVVPHEGPMFWADEGDGAWVGGCEYGAHQITLRSLGLGAWACESAVLQTSPNLKISTKFFPGGPQQGVGALCKEALPLPPFHRSRSLRRVLRPAECQATCKPQPGQLRRPARGLELCAELSTSGTVPVSKARPALTGVMSTLPKQDED